MLTGILMLIFVGCTWTLSGIVMGGATRHRLSIDLLQALMYALGVLVYGGIVICGTKDSLTARPSLILYAFSMYFCVGVLQYVLNALMCAAMARGPNSLVWAILQSGMVVPFLVGLFFHGVEATLLRILGMVLFLVALFLMSRKQEEGEREGTGRSWLFLAFLCFLVCGIQQSINNEPSYNAEIRAGIPGAYRALMIQGASLLFAIFALLRRGLTGVRSILREHLRRSELWIYAIGQQAVSIATTLFVTYKAMDRMADLGMGALSYPVMVITCIAGFTLYSILVLREKLTLGAALGLSSCLLGIVCISMNAA